MKKLFQSKIGKALMSAVLCVAVFFSPLGFSGFLVYSAGTVVTVVSSIIAWIDFALTVYELAEPFITTFREEQEAEFIKSQAAYYAFWAETDVPESFTKDEFIAFCECVMSGDVDSFCNTYEADVYQQEAYYDLLSKSVFYCGGYLGLADMLYSGAFDGYSLNDDGAPVMPSTDFKDVVDTYDSKYIPKNTMGKMTYRTDERWHHHYDSYTSAYDGLDLYADSRDGFFTVGGGNTMYFMFFYDSGTDNYYSLYQFKLVVNPIDPIYDSSGENITSFGTTVDLYLWSMIDGSEAEAEKVNFYTKSSYKYFDLNVVNYGRLNVRGFASYLDYVNFKVDKNVYKSFEVNEMSLVKCDDALTSVVLSNPSSGTDLTSHFKSSLSSHDETCEFGGDCDIGYVCSATPISLNYGIDTSKIPDNYYVTISGDSIYDYSITNEQGDSCTINEYVTNNYYITNNNGGDSSGGSGGTGGSVAVGGQIDVSGSVGVDVDVTVSVPDININVNDNGGAGGSSLPDVNTDPMDDYLTSAVEETSGFRKFMADFFDFMPTELIVLLGIGLTFVIVGRIMGR